MTDQPMTDDQRVLLEHCWAVRVNLPTDARHVAALALRQVGVARYASMPTETVERCERAAEQTEAVAAAIAGRVGAERVELARSGLDAPSFQKEVEQTTHPPTHRRPDHPAAARVTAQAAAPPRRRTMPRGSIRKRGYTWTVVVDAGRDPTTRKRRQTSKGGFRTKTEATRWLTQALGQLDHGVYVTPTRQTVGEYLLEWLPAIRSSLRPSTWESYERNIRRHLIPRIGHVYLHQLGPGHLSALYADLVEGGRLDGAGGLSPRSVRYLHTILGKALGDAVTEGKLARNVAQVQIVRRRLPKGSGADMTTWTAAQLTSFLGGLRGDRLEVPILLGATTGMRRGEVLGVRWSDVDLDAGRLAVRQTLSAPRNPDTGKHVPVFGEPKTKRGKRSVPLPAQTVAALRAHRKTQLEERFRVGADYADLGLMFAEPDGHPIHPDRFRKRFEHRVERSGLPRIRFHDLRHTYASLALQAGVHPKVVSEVLGHASIGITLDTYSHVIPSMGSSAAETVAALVFGGS